MLALILAIAMKSSAWWGDPANPNPNHVDATVDGVTPDAAVSGNVSFTLTCNLPAPSTLRLNGMMIQIDGNNIQSIYGADARARLGIPQTFTFNTANYNDGWHEFRGRCFGEETTSGPNLGKLTEVTAGHQLHLVNGNVVSNSSHSIPGIVDSHAFMLALRGDFEAAGGAIATHCRCTAAKHDGAMLRLTCAKAEGPFTLGARTVVNAAGLHATRVARLLGAEIGRAHV